HKFFAFPKLPSSPLSLSFLSPMASVALLRSIGRRELHAASFSAFKFSSASADGRRQSSGYMELKISSPLRPVKAEWESLLLRVRVNWVKANVLGPKGDNDRVICFTVVGYGLWLSQ
ncbi:unnamed protein product, partial [Thlaspi arvense]